MRAAGRAAAPTALLILAMVSAACRTPTPAFELLPPGDRRPQHLLDAWAERSETRRSLRGRARLAVDGPSVRLRGKQVVLAERPGRLRVEVKGLFDQTLAVLVIDDGQYELLRADDGSYSSGPVHPGLLWETAGIDLEAGAAIALLLDVPIPAPPLVILAAYADAAGDVRIDLGDAAGQMRSRVRFDALGRRVRVEHFGERETPVWAADYTDFSDVGGAEFPHRLTIATGEEARAEIELRDVDLNPELSPDLFRLRRPADRVSRAGRHLGN